MSRPFLSETRTPVADLFHQTSPCQSQYPLRSSSIRSQPPRPGKDDAPVSGGAELGHGKSVREVLGGLVGGKAGKGCRASRLGRGGGRGLGSLALLGGSLSGLEKERRVCGYRDKEGRRAHKSRGERFRRSNVRTEQAREESKGKQTDLLSQTLEQPKGRDNQIDRAQRNKEGRGKGRKMTSVAVAGQGRVVETSELAQQDVPWP